MPHTAAVSVFSKARSTATSTAATLRADGKKSKFFIVVFRGSSPQLCERGSRPSSFSDGLRGEVVADGLEMHEAHASFRAGFPEAHAFHQAGSNELVALAALNSENPPHVRDANKLRLNGATLSRPDSCHCHGVGMRCCLHDASEHARHAFMEGQEIPPRVLLFPLRFFPHGTVA